MNLLVVTDGKKGHENQSLGLAEALQRRTSDCIQICQIDELEKVAPSQTRLIIGTGHRTHPFLIRYARYYKCPSVVIMKPSLPKFLFSHCFIPEHDLKSGKKLPANVTTTKGALNRVPEIIPKKENQGLILLGGPSKHFDWNTKALIPAIEAIITDAPNLAWTIGDSRRTPSDLLSRLAHSGLPVTVAPHQEATGGWLVNNLLAAKTAWITPDSTSMLFEALTAGCQVGTLPLQARDTRLSRAHDHLVQENWVNPFSQLVPPYQLSAPPRPLHETSRCAEILLAQLINT